MRVFLQRRKKFEKKGELFNETEINICRIDHDNIVQELQKREGKLVTWGIDRSDASIRIEKDGNTYRFQFDDLSYDLEIQLQNIFDLENIIHAICVAMVLGESNEKIQKGLKKIKAVPMRLEFKRGRNNNYILDDSYNNDLIGLEIALDYLLQQPHRDQKTVILSDILQSGKAAEVLYPEVNRLFEKHGVQRVIGIGDSITKNSNHFTMNFTGYRSTDLFLKSAPDFSDQMILVKGARNYELERVVAYLEDRNHGTVFEVNFESLINNLNCYREQLEPDVRLMVMVKAFAYGAGVDEIAHLLQYHKVDYFGVAYLDEAVNLRRKGIHLPIMIMNVEWSSFPLLQTFHLEPEIYSLKMLEKFLDDCSKPPPIHLKIETGMNRLGFPMSEVSRLIEILVEHPELKVAGIFTHFSSADMVGEDEFTRNQAAIFESAYRLISEALGYFPLKHALNSSGIIRWKEYQFDMVRLGIGLYGFDSTKKLSNLRPIGTLKTRISQIKEVKSGESIGYGRQGRAERDSQIATIAIGYADGYARAFGNGHAHVLVRGQEARTIGNVCMDMTMIDVTGLQVEEGDEVIVFGEHPSISELAGWINTIPYEILTNVSQRVKRIFVSE